MRWQSIRVVLRIAIMLGIVLLVAYAMLCPSEMVLRTSRFLYAWLFVTGIGIFMELVEYMVRVREAELEEERKDNGVQVFLAPHQE